MRTKKKMLWVVYRTTLRGKQGKSATINVICQQGEWDAMELAQPGHHTLVQAGIASEGEAERLARGSSGDALSPWAKRL
jgi:hypothetical protein